MSKWITIEEGCVWPKSEQVVEVKLSNGFVGFAMFDCNIQDAGDWDLTPLDENGDPTMDTVADQAVAWREAATALDRLSGRVTVKALEFGRFGEAHGLAGRYAVYVSSSGCRAVFYPLPDGPSEDLANSVSDAEAYAAVRRHHESRILAALDTAPTPSPDQIKRKVLKIVKRKSAEARKYPGASVAVTYLDEVADAIEALITGGDDDAA